MASVSARFVKGKSRFLVVDDVPGCFAATVSALWESTKHQPFTMALSGGSVAPCYEQLSLTEIDWRHVTLLWGDERIVPLDHQDSNFGLARNALLSRIPVGTTAIPMTNTGMSAVMYHHVLVDQKHLDLVHLGLGTDGHTASLFPGSPALRSPEGVWVVDTGDNLHPHPRRTLTFEGIAQFETALFTVTGSHKADIFARIFGGEDLPANHVDAKNILWILDPEAAAYVPELGGSSTRA